MIDGRILTTVCDEIEEKIKTAKNATRKKELNKCVSEIDFYYETLRRFNGGILPWSDERFRELNQGVEKIKTKMRLVICPLLCLKRREYVRRYLRSRGGNIRIKKERK